MCVGRGKSGDAYLRLAWYFSAGLLSPPWVTAALIDAHLTETLGSFHQVVFHFALNFNSHYENTFDI